MRGASARPRRHEEEEESVFVSMTDMTVGFLFIVILLLAFFASQYNSTETVARSEYERVVAERDELQVEVERLRSQLIEVSAERDVMKERVAELEAQVAALEEALERLRQPNPLEAYINNSMDARRQILHRLRDLIADDFPDLQLVLSEESLRFQGEGLFRRGDAVLLPERRGLIEAVADRLQQILPCYSLGSANAYRKDCNAGFALIEAVQIEGHTDSDGDDMRNLELSASRATNTFRAMTQHQGRLVEHLNFQEQPVLSVAGYGRMRPVAANDTAENKASNRRIDLRIIMHVPRDTEEIDRVRSAFMSDPMRDGE